MTAARRRGRTAVLLLVPLLVLVLAPAAQGAVTASLDGTTLTVTGGPNRDVIRVATDAGGTIHVFSTADEEGEVTVTGGTPTVGNVDTIDVSTLDGPDRIVLDETAGAFAPGATPEGDGSSEIEIHLDAGLPGKTQQRSHTDEIELRGQDAAGDVVGVDPTGTGFDVGLDGDADITVTGMGFLYLYGQGGDDLLQLATPTGDGCAQLPEGAAVAALFGGDGRDDLGGSAADKQESFGGGAGDDRLDGARCVAAGQHDGADIMTGDPGHDRLIGRGGNDVLYGSKAADHLDGGTGRDSVHGGNGPDVVIGGPGRSDFLYGEAGTDDLRSADGKNDVVSGGDDEDQCLVDALDDVTSCENVTVQGAPAAR
jgi:Ca2+-binding RTX toxin-like protein